MPHRSLLHEAIRDASNPVTVFDRVVLQSLALVHHADGASLEMRRDTETMEYVAAAGTLAPFLGLRLSVGASLSGRALLTGEVQRTDDALLDPRVSASAVATTGVRSMLCVPLAVDGEPLATLKVSSQHVAAFTDGDVVTLQQLAGFLAVTLRAASDIASATAQLLDPSGAQEDQVVERARFVANIMAPGLADAVDSRTLLQDALAAGSVPIVLQPIVDLESGRATAVEALARFSGHPDHSPDWWFAQAQAHDLGTELELLAVRSALALFPRLPAPVRMAVNVGPATLLSPDFIDVIRQAPLDRLTIELTEHAEVVDYQALLDVRHLLRRLEVRVAMDDAGTGFSGLSRLRQLLPDFIKIDRDLVQDVHRDPVRQALCTALVDFGRRIDAVVIGEGVETADEARTLRELGVHRGQGFHFGRPMPIAALLQWLPSGG